MRPNSETHFVGALVVVAEPPHDLFELGQGDLVEEDERYEWEDVLDEEGRGAVDFEEGGGAEGGERPVGGGAGQGGLPGAAGYCEGEVGGHGCEAWQ